MRRNSSSRPYLTAILLLSLAVIGGALIFQFGVGLKPCELCLKERFPWYAAIVVSLCFLAVNRRGPARFAAALLCILFGVSFLFGLYHVGVEQKWLQGPQACTGDSLSGLSLEEATRRLFSAPPVRCDVAQWTLFHISLAGWNALASLAAFLYSVTEFRRGRRR